MKHRYLAASCAVLLLFLLTACGSKAKTAASGDGMQGERTTGTAPSGPSDGADNLADQNRFLCGYDQRAARIGDVLYYTQYGAQDVPMIFAVDLNTMEAFPSAESRTASIRTNAAAPMPAALETRSSLQPIAARSISWIAFCRPASSIG